MFAVKTLTNSNLINCKSVLYILRRCKSINKFKKKTPSAVALNHFDTFYKSFFENKWPSVRLALLCEGKYMAVVNNFGDSEATEDLLKQEGAFNLKSFLEIEKKNSSKKPKQNEDKSVKDKVKIKEEKEKSFSYSSDNIRPSNEVINEQLFNSEEDMEKHYSYNPGDEMTSLQADLSNSEIEISRLITPNSTENKEALFQFVPATKLIGKTDFVPLTEYFKYYKAKDKFEINIVPELNFDFPKHLKAYVFDRGEVTEFPERTKFANEVFNFLEVDGGELLTVLALDVKPGDAVLHVSNNTGNMGYCIFQTLNPKVLICSSEKNEFEKIFVDYLFDYEPAWKEMLILNDKNLMEYDESYVDIFDKILVDVPCTEDKKSLFEDEDNVFTKINIKYRLKLPEVQTQWLSKALKLVKPGGTVVYTTSSLSPVQNEGVVAEALISVYDETKMNFTVKNMSSVLDHTKLFYNFGSYLPIKFGTLIVPFLPSNFGPRYFCKIEKNKE